LGLHGLGGSVTTALAADSTLQHHPAESAEQILGKPGSQTERHHADPGRFDACHASRVKYSISTLSNSDEGIDGLALCGLAGINDLAGGNPIDQTTTISHSRNSAEHNPCDSMPDQHL
jgi:hypothetical protein